MHEIGCIYCIYAAQSGHIVISSNSEMQFHMNSLQTTICEINDAAIIKRTSPHTAQESSLSSHSFIFLFFFMKVTDSLTLNFRGLFFCLRGCYLSVTPLLKEHNSRTGLFGLPRTSMLDPNFKLSN